MSAPPDRRTETRSADVTMSRSRESTAPVRDTARAPAATQPAQAALGNAALVRRMRQASAAAPAATLDTGSPGAILDSLARVPASAALATYAQASRASAHALQAQRAEVEASLPRLPTPTGLPARARTSPRPSSEPGTPTEQGQSPSRPASASTASEQDTGPLVPEAPAAPAPTPTRLERAGAGGTQGARPEEEPVLAQSAQDALASVQLPGDAVPPLATRRPTVELGGDADPSLLESAQDTSGQQTREAQAQAARALQQDAGENAIAPAPDDSVLQATLPGRSPEVAGASTAAPADVPAEALASIDAEVSPLLQERIGAEQQRYTQAEARHDAHSQAAHARAHADIATLEEQAHATQTRTQAAARAEVARAREDGRGELDQLETDFHTRARSARREHGERIETEAQAGNRRADAHLTRAEQEAEQERRRAEAETERRRREAARESGGFWGWARSAARALIDGLKSAVNFIYNNLRRAVRGIFDVARRLALGAIELARMAIVGIIQGYGALLRGLVRVTLAAFPATRDRMLQRIDRAVASAVERVNSAAAALKRGVTAVLNFLAETLDRLLGLIQDIYNGIFTVLGMLISGELAQLLARLGNLVAAARTAPGQFETAAYEELLGGNLDQPLSPAELLAAGRAPPAAAAGTAPGAASRAEAETPGEEPLPGPPWTEGNVGVDAVAGGETLSPELTAELLQRTGGGEGEVSLGESADPDRSLDALLGPRGAEQARTPGPSEPSQEAHPDDGLTPRQRAEVKWAALRRGLSEWWSNNWPYVLAGGVLGVAGFIVANVLTGGAILAALPAIMSVVGTLFTGVTVLQLAGHVRDYLRKGWNGDIPGGGRSLAKGLAAGAIELISLLTFRVGGAVLRGARTAARGTAALARGALRLARRGVEFVLRGGKVLLRGVGRGIAQGVRRLRELGARLLSRTRFRGFRIRLQGRRFRLEGLINPWVLLAEGRLVEVEAERLPANVRVGERVEVLLDRRRTGIVVSAVDEPPDLQTLQRVLDANPNFVRPNPLFPDSVNRELRRVRDIEDRIARLEAKRAAGRLSQQERQELQEARSALEPGPVEGRTEFQEARSEATRLVPSGTRVPPGEVPQLAYAQSLMNELNKAAARLGDGSVAYSIIAEQVRGGRYAMAVIGDTLHAVKGIDAVDRLRRLARPNVALPASARTRLLAEAAKIESAVEWARRYSARIASGGTSSLDNLPEWAARNADTLEELLRQRRAARPTPPGELELRRHREWNE